MRCGFIFLVVDLILILFLVVFLESEEFKFLENLFSILLLFFLKEFVLLGVFLLGVIEVLSILKVLEFIIFFGVFVDLEFKIFLEIGCFGNVLFFGCFFNLYFFRGEDSFWGMLEVFGLEVLSIFFGKIFFVVGEIR